jgi:hypothetical protein
MAKKIKIDQLFVLTANDLSSGDIVFWSDESRWTQGITSAHVIAANEHDTFVELGNASENANEVVGAYLTPVERKDSALQPIELRERRRVAGPSIAYGTFIPSQKIAA